MATLFYWGLPDRISTTEFAQMAVIFTRHTYLPDLNISVEHD
jgi:hypothetical protein